MPAPPTADHRAAPPGLSPPAEHGETSVLAALQAVFGTPPDRIVCEPIIEHAQQPAPDRSGLGTAARADSAPRAPDEERAGGRIRKDSAADESGAPSPQSPRKQPRLSETAGRRNTGIVWSPAGFALDRAAELTRDRRRRNADRWIVAVVDIDSLSKASAQRALGDLLEVDSRFLLIVRSRDASGNGRSSPPTAGSGAAAVEDRQRLFALLRLTRFAYAGAVPWGDADGLLSRLQSIRERGDASVLWVHTAGADADTASAAAPSAGETDRQKIEDRGSQVENARANVQETEPRSLSLLPRSSPSRPEVESASLSEKLEQLGFTPESLRRERSLVEATELSSDVERWFGMYRQVGSRGRYTWQWCVHGAELTTLPCVLPEWREHLRDTKVLSIMLCVLLDDVADELNKRELLEALLTVVEKGLLPDMSTFTDEERFYAEVTRELTDIYERRIRQYPCYAAYRDLLHFDLMQYFNTMRYSCLLNQQLSLLNVAEHELYLPHAMHMMSFSTLDLMCTPSFPVSELGQFREAMWYLQCMGRVGNLLSTWKREIGQEDFTSGVFSRALIEGDLSLGQLKNRNPTDIQRAIEEGGHELFFLERWCEHRERFQEKVPRVPSIDLSSFLRNHERFFQMHLACRGRI